MSWNRRHLLTLEELSLAEIEQIHTVATAFKKVLGRSVKKIPALRGKTIVNLFLEPSTRTRMAFDMAAKRLSADVISFDAASSSTTKGETLRDTAENIAALGADMIVLRHSCPGSPLYRRKRSSGSSFVSSLRTGFAAACAAPKRSMTSSSPRARSPS